MTMNGRANLCKRQTLITDFFGRGLLMLGAVALEIPPMRHRMRHPHLLRK